MLPSSRRRPRADARARSLPVTTDTSALDVDLDAHVPCEWPTACTQPATRAGRALCVTAHPWHTFCDAHAAQLEQRLRAAAAQRCVVDQRPLPWPFVAWRPI